HGGSGGTRHGLRTQHRENRNSAASGQRIGGRNDGRDSEQSRRNRSLLRQGGRRMNAAVAPTLTKSASLSIRKVNQLYGGTQILWDLDLEIPAGSCTCIMGRNGVGKTTLLKCLMGLLPIKTG